MRFDLVIFAIPMRAPISRPSGWGFISTTAGGGVSVARLNTNVWPEGSANVICGPPQVLEYRLLARYVAPLQGDGDLGAVGLPLPDDVVGAHDLRGVCLGVEDQVHLHGHVPVGDFRAHGRRFPRRQLAVHNDGRDADALLPSRLAHGVEARAVEQPREDVGDVALDDAGTVVLNRDAVLGLVQRLDFHGQLGEYARLLAGVERVVDCLLDGGDEALYHRVEAENLLVPLEELGDGDFLLLLRQFFRDAGRSHRYPSDGPWMGPHVEKGICLAALAAGAPDFWRRPGGPRRPMKSFLNHS
jgi:hypothetical protein